MSRDGSQTKRKRDATTGSTVKAHLKCKTCNGKAVSSSGHCLACLSCHPSLPEIEEIEKMVLEVYSDNPLLYGLHKKQCEIIDKLNLIIKELKRK